MSDILSIKPLPQRTIIPSLVNIFVFFGIIFFAYFFFIIFGSEIIEVINSTLDINIQIIFGIILALFFLIAIIRLVLNYLKIKNTVFQISEKSITYNQEFISINKLSIPTSQITNIDSYVSFFWDKVFKTGTLQIYTSGSSSVDLILSDIYNVDEMYHKIQQYTQISKKSTNNLNSSSSNTKSVSSKPLLSIKPNIKIAIVSTLLPLIPAGVFFIIPFFGILIPLIIGIFTQTNLLLSILGLIVLLLVTSIVLIGIPYYSYKYYSNISYYFYEDNVEYFDGFFNVQKHTMPYKRITNSNSFQSLFDRILGVHTITIETAGSSQSQIIIKYVNNGEEINNQILEILQQKGDN